MKCKQEAYDVFYEIVHSFFDNNDYQKAQKYYKTLAILEMETASEDFENRAIEWYILSKLVEAKRIVVGEPLFVQEENELAFRNGLYKKYDLDSAIQFGKYEGSSIKEIAKKDLFYLLDQINANPAFHITRKTMSFLIIKLDLDNIDVFYQMSYKDSLESFLTDFNFTTNRFNYDIYDSPKDSIYNEPSQEDIYWEGGGGNEWSDPTQFWD